MVFLLTYQPCSMILCSKIRRMKKTPCSQITNVLLIHDFVENCRKWLTRGYDADFMSIDDIDSMYDVAQNGKILVWNGHCTKDDAFMSHLVSRIPFFRISNLLNIDVF